MKTLDQIKAEHQTKVNNLLAASLVFWAFSTEQFEQNKTPLADGDKYVSIGSGGYCPASKVKELQQGFADIKVWHKAAMKNDKLRKANIAYELANHEAYYTGSIEDTLEALGSDYTAQEVREVYHKERKKQAA